jgi:hypothetical protein
MHKIVYKEKSLEIQKNMLQSNWRPLYNTVVEAFKFEDIDKELFAQLSNEDQEMIMYFFEDLWQIDADTFVNSNEYKDFKNS